MAERTLPEPPSLLPLYLRAALPRGSSTGTVPGTTLRLAGRRPPVEHVAAYAGLCGYRLGPHLPLTYPHLLGFPLQMALMSERAFPFPATGLVHVANEVTQRRGLPVGAPLDVAVTATGPRPHRKGRTVDMLTTVSVDAEVAWTSTSTYLRREKGGAGSTGAGTDLPEVEIEEGLATTSVWRLPRDLGRRYAAVSGDRNPIHLSALSAKALGFPRAIAHGMWTAAACVAAFEGRLPADVHVGVRFSAPVLLPSTVELATRTAGATSAAFLLRSRGGRPHVAGRIVPGST